MKARRSSRRAAPASVQRGQAMLLSVLLLAVGIVAIVYNFAAPAKQSLERDRVTAAALAEAKAALLGYAVGVNLAVAGPRPGDLPCPDLDDDGSAATPGVDLTCGGAVVGRLPWRTLGLPDLRDGYGERLWYAVSSNFRNSPRTACGSAGAAGCLNSDARGTITVRDINGAVIHDGSNPNAFTPSGVLAVIISPGPILQRQGGAQQDRSAAGANNAVNYLDVLASLEDNANFADGSATNGFMNGSSASQIVNDRVLTIKYSDLLPLLERRVAKEARNCLDAYAAVPQNSGRYPWAVPMADITEPYADQASYRFGRIPDTFNATFLGLGGAVALAVCPLPLVGPVLCHTTSWPASCNLTVGTWWTNWKDQVIYGVATPYQPGDPISALLGIPAPGGCGGSCLRVDPPSAASDKKFVVMTAGKRLSGVAGGQPRSSAANKANPANYLEGENGNLASPYQSQNFYEQRDPITTFNDTLLFRQ